MKAFYIAAIVLITATYSRGQGERVVGKVTFVTSQNVYVKFDNTENINIGDTLRFAKGNAVSPCLVVNNKSSSSCVCSVIKGCDLKKDDQVFYYQSASKKKITDTKPATTTTTAPTQSAGAGVNPNRERISARISASGYSNISSTRDDSHRMMYGFSFNADHIKNSKFSLETYLTYRQYFFPTYESVDRKDKFFNVYSAAFRYDVTSTFSMLVGRRINDKASSLGAVDGLQAEKSFNKFFVGALVGFRPDMFDYGFNKDLFQYSAYIGIKTDGKKSYSTTTLGYLEQRNAWKVDRRYLYFQHSSSVSRKLSFFASSELDIFNNVSDSTDVLRLTNLYISSTYRVNKYFDLTASYDTRKQIVYYETYQDYIEELLENDESRQGLRFNVNVKPYKTISIGASYSRRFQKSGANKSDNINGYASVSKVPWIGGRFNVNYNWNRSNYLVSKALTFRYSRYLLKNKLSTDLYFRMVDYDYLNHEINERQLYYGAGIYYYLNKKLSVNVMGEIATRSSEKNYRINAGIIMRFDKKAKK